MPARMHAIVQSVFGGPEVLTYVETDVPEPGPGEVLLRVAGAGVNPGDTVLRSGRVPELVALPWTPGDEESGAVADGGGDVLAAEETGADEVVGVACVEAGAGRADGGASVAAADQESFAGLGAGVVVVQDLAGCAVEGGGRAGEVDGVGAAAGCGDLLQPARELRVLCDAECVAVCFGELTQARRAVEGGTPVSRGELRGDGGDLPGSAAEAARVMVGGAQSVMGVTSFWVGGAGGSADGSGAPADAAAAQSSGPGPAGSVALAERAPHARHGHGGGSLLLRCGRSR